MTKKRRDNFFSGKQIARILEDDDPGFLDRLARTVITSDRNQRFRRPSHARRNIKCEPAPTETGITDDEAQWWREAHKWAC